LHFEEFDASELEPALYEIADSRRAEACGESRDALLRYFVPSDLIICLNAPIIPVLKVFGSSWILVLTTSTGVNAPWVREQQMPPARAPLRK
jgi:hypothetical protein